MHKIQRKILKLLIDKNARRYSELFKNFSYEDKFAYHLKQLLRYQFINKRDGLYFITDKGIKEKAHYNSRTLQEIHNKILRFLFVCKYKRRYLLHECFRDDDKRENVYVLPGGSPLQGERIIDGCKKLLRRKFHIRGELQYRATHHYINITSYNDILFDNICLIFDVDVQEIYKNQSSWYLISEIRKLKNKHPMIDRYILQQDKSSFSTSEFIDNFGFEKQDH